MADYKVVFLQHILEIRSMKNRYFMIKKAGQDLMKEYLKIQRNIDKENKLKELIEEIEELLDTGNDELVEEKLEEANTLVTAYGKILNEYMVRYYYSWTDLDGLAGELTINVPKIDHIEEQDLEELIIWMRKVIFNEETLEDIDYGYFDHYYREFFLKNFPNGEEAYEAIFEECRVQEVIELAYQEKENNIILL